MVNPIIILIAAVSISILVMLGIKVGRVRRLTSHSMADMLLV